MARRATGGTAPEPRLTGGRVLLVYSLALIFDSLKFIFSIFVIAAPFLVGAAVKIYGDLHSWPSWFSSLAATFAGAATGVAEFVVQPVTWAIMGFGIVMAMAIGFVGWLTLPTLLLIWRVNVWQPTHFTKTFFGSLASIFPILNMFPTFTPTVWLIIRAARKEDRAALEKWRQTNADQEQQEMRQMQMVQAIQYQRQMEAAEAANDNEIPEEAAQAA